MVFIGLALIINRIICLQLMISIIGISSTLLSPFISRCIWYVYLSGHLYIIIYWYICFLSINMCINNPWRNNSWVSLQSRSCCKEKYVLSSRLNLVRSNSPLCSQGHKRIYEPIHHEQKENLFRGDEYFIGHGGECHLPESTKDTVIEVHVSEVRCGDPNIQQVKDELISNWRAFPKYVIQVRRS